MRVFALLLLCLPGLAGASPQVVATIKPLTLIAAEITQGVSEPRQLLSAGASPHDYQLRPSDLRTLKAAELVLWLGPQIEPFLAKPLHNLDSTDALNLLAVIGEQASIDNENHHDQKKAGHSEDTHGHGHNHDTAGTDPHIWLSPRLAVAMASAIRGRLSQLDPANAGTYATNFDRFKTAVEKADAQLKKQLEPLRHDGYFVFHDGFSHFERHYGLNHLGAFTLSPERRPGARQLATIRTQLENSEAKCVFSEPQFDSRLIQSVTEGLSVRRGALDPLATDASSYTEFLNQLGAQFVDCLER